MIFYRSPQEHIGHVRKAVTLLQNAGVTLKQKKCWIFTETIDYLGYVIRPRHPEIASHTTSAISGLQAPTNLTEFRSFLGLCDAFRQFIPNFARIAAPLNAKRRRDQPKRFGPLNDEKLKPMNLLKDALISLHILNLPNSTGHMTLDSDACHFQVGCVLLQVKEDNTTRRIGYQSRSLTATKR